jgi:hypothetical protein
MVAISRCRSPKADAPTASLTATARRIPGTFPLCDGGFDGTGPVTFAVMRAAASCPPQVPDVVIGGGKVAVTPKLGRRLEFSSAACLWAMLLHPEPRGGGDIEPTEFPEIGRWRHDRLLLTSEYDDNGTTRRPRLPFGNSSGTYPPRCSHRPKRRCDP